MSRLTGHTMDVMKGLAIGFGVLLLLSLAPERAGAQEEPSSPDSTPRLTGEPDLRIGSVVGEPEYTFGRIMDVAYDATGRIFVADADAKRVRVYDGSGSHLFDVGRSGQGPGEFSSRISPCAIALEGDDRLWAADYPYQLHQYEVGSDGARHIRSLRLGAASVCAALLPAVRSGAVGVAMPSARSGHGVHVHVDSAGDTVHETSLPQPVDVEELGWADRIYPRSTRNPEGSVYHAPFPSPFSPRDLIAHAPDGSYARSVTSTYRVEIFDSQGREMATIERDVTGGPPMTVADVAQAQSRLDSLREHVESAGGEFEPYEIRDRKPPVQDIWYDEEGRLWVQIWPDPDYGRNLAHVYDAGGRPLFVADWPASIELDWGSARGCAAAGTEDLEYDVQRVVRVRFTPASSASGKPACAS